MRNPITSDGKNVVSIFPTEGSRKTVVTHNWADKTTWYQKATRVVEETLSATTAGTVYQAANTNLIDLYHGKIFGEDFTLDGQGNSYRVTIEVDDGGGFVEKTENDPHDGSGDYSIDYAAGTVTFSPAIGVSDTVRATYHKAEDSEFIIGPEAGKKLMIRSVETQFTDDITMTDSIDFVAYGYADIFAPHLVNTYDPPGPYPPLTKIPLSTTRYKTMADFQAESNGSLPTIPKVGGLGWRGITKPIIVFPWDYAALLPLSYAAGMEIRIKLRHDVAFTGELATATLYCLSEDDG